VVPGLFGFRFDTPDGGAYWGRAGSDLAWDDYLKSDRQGPPPRAIFRAGAGSCYAGILVILLAVFGVAQSFRKQGGLFIDSQRKLVWFWCAVVVVALLLMFGRFAPFYQFFYALPYVSTIRNPAKFLHVVEWALLILFAYGADALWRKSFGTGSNVAGGLVAHWKAWWKKAAGFNRKWVIGSVAVVGICGLAWLLYASSRGELEKHILELTTLQYGGRLPDSIAATEAANAAATARHSVGQVGRTLLFLVPAVGLVALALSGYFAGRRARIGGALFVVFIIMDLFPVNRHWIRTPNWKEKYESNSVPRGADGPAALAGRP
jgi:branched-subunit amino acid transport protein AzlD